MASAYHIWLQPNEGKTLTDPGVSHGGFMLTSEQLLGIQAMALNHFSIEANSFIRIYDQARHRDVILDENHPQFIGLHEPPYQPNWLQYVTEHLHPGNYPILRYTLVLHEPGSLQGYIWTTNSLEFLQGVMALAQWIGQDWRQMVELYEGNQKQRFLD